MFYLTTITTSVQFAVKVSSVANVFDSKRFASIFQLVLFWQERNNELQLEKSGVEIEELKRVNLVPFFFFLVHMFSSID